MSHIRLSPGLPLTASIAFIPACSLVVGLRFYARRVQKISLGIDDWLVVPALVLVIGMQVTMIIEYCYRLVDFPDPRFQPGVVDARPNLPFYPIEVMEIPALGLTKLSFIFLFRRIFNTGLFRWFHHFSMVLICIVSSWMVSFFFSWIFICGTHPSDYWKSAEVERAKCVKTTKMHNAFAISDFTLDVIILLMTVPLVWRLHMTLARKVAVTAIFSFGLITVAASTTRMVIYLQATAARYSPDIDFELLITDTIYWSMLEVGLGLIVANLVVVYGLISARWFPRLCNGARGVFSLVSSSSSRLSSRSQSGSSQSGKAGEQEKPEWDDIVLVQDHGFVESSANCSVIRPANRSDVGNLEAGKIWTLNTVQQTEHRLR